MKQPDPTLLFKNLQYRALIVLREIDELRIKIPVVSLKGISIKDAKQLLSNTTYYLSIRELIEGNIDDITKNSKKSFEWFSHKFKEYDSDLDIMASIIDYLLIIKAILNDENKENYLLLFELAEFCHEVVSLISSIYGYGLSRNTYFMVPLIKLSGVHSITSLELTESSNVLFVSLFPYGLYETPDLYILSLHEFGHLFKEFYLNRRGKWSLILNETIKKLININGITGSTKSIDYDKRYRYKWWLKELFADYFAFMVLGKSYIDALWRHYGYFVPDRYFAENSETEYPPLAMRFKILDIAFDKLGIKNKPLYLLYIDKILRENSNKLLAGYLEFNELIDLITMLSDLFYNAIVENPYNEPPYTIITLYKEKFPRLFSLISS